MSPTVKGAIAAGHEKTVEAGQFALQEGGNAFDAAIAALLAACVVEPMLTGLGGGGFCLAHTAQGHNILFDFFTQTPQTRHPKPDFYPVTVNFGDASQDFHIGLGSIATPGTIAGIFHIHQRLGRLPLTTLFAPAIHYADQGHSLNAFEAYCLKLLTPILSHSEPGRQIYQPQDHPLATGDRLHIPHLAQTLRTLAHQGPDWFYNGDLGQRFLQDSQTLGGHLTAADLRDYRVIERSPLQLDYRDHTLLTNPPPSSGGILIALALTLLSQTNLSNTFGSETHLQTLIQTLRLSEQVRRQHLDPNLYDDAIATKLLSQLPSSLASKLGSTTHLSVIDTEGNAASITSSNGEGSGYLIPNSGIMLNNMLGEEDLNPHGFHQWPPNQRLSSMMAPSLLLPNRFLSSDQTPDPSLIALGSGGSNRIRTALLQVILNLLDFQMPLAEAIAAPRLHWERNLLNTEPGLDLTTVSLPANEQHLPWSSPNMFFGGVHAVRWHPASPKLENNCEPNCESNFEAIGDFRRSGASYP